MPDPPKATLLIDVLEEHLEGLAFLWEQWKNQVAGNGSNRSFDELQRRIVAHIRGVEVYGEAAVPLLNQYFESDETGEVFAATSNLLNLKLYDIERLTAVLSDMTSPQLPGVCDALCQCMIDDDIRDMLNRLLKNGAPTAVVNAAYVLSFQGESSQDVDEYLTDDDPVLRRQAWRVKAMSR